MRRFGGLRTGESVLGKLESLCHVGSHYRARRVFICLCLIFTFTTVLPGQSDLKQAGVCSRCHVVSVLEWEISKHSQAATDCRTCHGPSQAHVANERNEVSPDRIPRGETADLLCASCHTAGCPQTKRDSGCLECHNSHSLTKPYQIQRYEGDRSAHPIREAVAHMERFRAAMDRAEALVEQQDWPAAKSAFEEALRLAPDETRILRRLAFVARRLSPAMPGFELAGEGFDAETGLDREVRIRGLGIPMVLAPPGEFDMGSDDFEAAKPVHTVAVAAFYLGKYEITQAQWEAVMGENPSGRRGSGQETNLPVERVSWHDAQNFVNRLNEQVEGGDFRLPTEAEWEYGAGAGSGLFKEFELARYAWYRGTTMQRAEGEDFVTAEAFSTRPAGTKEPNAWGFHDMHGNVSEWTSSLLRPYFYDPADGRESPTAPGLRVLRGGGYADAAGLLHPALRHGERPNRRYRWNGLRIARTAPPPGTKR